MPQEIEGVSRVEMIDYRDRAGAQVARGEARNHKGDPETASGEQLSLALAHFSHRGQVVHYMEDAAFGDRERLAESGNCRRIGSQQKAVRPR